MHVSTRRDFIKSLVTGHAEKAMDLNAVWSLAPDSEWSCERNHLVVHYRGARVLDGQIATRLIQASRLINGKRTVQEVISLLESQQGCDRKEALGAVQQLADLCRSSGALTLA